MLGDQIGSDVGTLHDLFIWKLLYNSDHKYLDAHMYTAVITSSDRTRVYNSDHK